MSMKEWTDLDIDNLELLEVTDIEKARVKQHVLKKRKKAHIWRNIAVAFAMIIGTGFAFGGSYMVDAAQSLINQLFGSKENIMQAYPEESQEEISLFEGHLEIAEENLTEEEFAKYTQLIKEQTEIWSKVREENREPDEREAARLHQLGELQHSISGKFALKEAQQYASYTITKPTYIPEGYKQVDESFAIYNEGEEPVSSFDYRKGEFGFSTQQLKINQKDGIENHADGFFEKPESYSLNGFAFDYVYSKEERVGMRVTVPDKGYKVVIIAEQLSKEEMEKVLLSMVEK